MNSASSDPPPTLLTFAPMVDSETSRLLLAYYGVRYREHDNLIPLVMLKALLHGGMGLVPLFYGDGFRLTSPRPIAEHFEPGLPAERRLIPADGDPLRGQVEADWVTFNGEMGADTAAFAYFHLLPERQLMVPIFAAPVSPIQAKLTPTLYPLMKVLFGAILKLGPQHAADAQARIRATFERTDKRIADGRPYLCGDRITLGDFGLAAASAPLLLPQGYGAKMPALEQMPPVLRTEMEELRQRPTAGFVQRLYSEGFAAARARS